jgi:hypothetical protein
VTAGDALAAPDSRSTTICDRYLVATRRSPPEADGIEHRFERNPTPLLSERLEPGSYRVTSFQRPCGPSGCEGSGIGFGLSSKPLARCAADFEVRGRQPVDVVITVDPVDFKCRIATGFVELG